MLAKHRLFFRRKIKVLDEPGSQGMWPHSSSPPREPLLIQLQHDCNLLEMKRTGRPLIS